MRGILEVLEARRPIPLASSPSRGAGWWREHRYFGRMAKRNLAKDGASVTRLDPKLARPTMEPRASTPFSERRLEALLMMHLKRLTDAGIRTTAMVAPLFPAERFRARAHPRCGPRMPGFQGKPPTCCRLPLEVRDLFREWLWPIIPGPLSTKSRNWIAYMQRGGVITTSQWARGMEGHGRWPWMIGRHGSRSHADKKARANKRPLELTTDHCAARSGAGKPGV